MQQNIFTDIAPASGFEGQVLEALTDKVQTRYERVIINRSTENISVVEQNGLVYPVYPDSVQFEGVIVIKECWTFPEIALPDIKELLNSESRCADSLILKQWREKYQNEELSANYGSFRLELEHRINLDSLREFKVIYHYHTNLLIGVLRPSEMLEHPQSILGKERLALNYDTLTQCKEAIGWRLELVDNQGVLGKGIYVYDQGLGIVHIKPIKDPVRKSAVIYVGSKGGNQVDHHIFDLDKMPEDINGVKLFKTIKEAKEYETAFHMRDIEHEREMAAKKRELEEITSSNKIKLEKLRIQNQEFEKELEELRNLRNARQEEQDEIARRDTWELRREDRSFKREENQNKKEEMSIKAVLTWATAVIGGVTLANKLF